MSKKINSYFLIFMVLFSLIPVQAAPPTHYYEIDSDTELRGAIFVNVDPSGFYAFFDKGVISITSIIHHTDVDIKFKGIALNAKLKKYNGFNIGYTHIDDNGKQTNIVKPLVIDNQGFAYLTTDFSTVIINGMTGTTTTILTDQNGNISVPVPNGTLYNVNITNNQKGLWAAASDGLGNTSLFKNRSTYTINSSIVLSDYQIKLNNTASNSDRWTYENGTYINNFNGSYIDTWVKLGLDIGDNIIYKYDGNDALNSGSNGNDVFIQYNGLETTGFYMNDNIITPSNIIVEFDYIDLGGSSDVLIGLSNTDPSTDDSIGMHFNKVGLYTRTWTKNEGLQNFGTSDFSHSLDTTHHNVLIQLTDVLNLFIDGVSVNDVNDTITADEDMSLFLYDPSSLSSYYSFVRQYTDSLPTYTNGTKQQISGVAEITAYIINDSNTQNYNTSETKDFFLTPDETTNNVNITTTSINYDVAIITYWTDNTTLQTETISNGYANQTINYTSNDYNVSAHLNTIYTFNFSAQDYIGTVTSTLNDVSKTTTRNGQNVNASVGELIAGINYYWNVTVLYNNIFTLANQTDQTAFIGVPKTFTDSEYNDPDDNPILSRLWNFGDGDTSSGSNPSHTYTSLGNLNANYTVTEDAATNSQTITKEFNMSVLVQPVQDLITEDLDQTWIKFNWSDYSSADLWNVFELEEGAPYSTASFILDGIKDASYDTDAHAFVFDTPNPVSNLNYETVYWVRTGDNLTGYADGFDADTKTHDDYFKIGIDNTGNGLTTDDRLYELNEGGTVTANRWTGSQWIPIATNAEGVVVGAGGNGAIQYEMIIPLSELSGFVNGAPAKFMMERECTNLIPTVETFYPTDLINETDGSLWANATLTATPIYNYIGNTTISEYNSTGLTAYTWYRHQFITVNNSVNSTPVYSDDITADVPHYTVGGYILDTFGNGVYGANVFSRNGIIGEITQSDANGYYIGYNFEIGNYSIYGNKSGYQENFTNVYVTANMTNINVTLTPFEISDWEIYQELLTIQSQNDEILLNMSVNNTIINDKLDTVLIFILLNMVVVVGVIIGRRSKEND